MAHPFLPSASLRSRFDLYLNPTELSQIKAQAATVHLSTSAFIRNAALSRRIEPPPSLINLEAWRSLAKVGNNLNQLAYAVAAGRAHGVDAAVIQDLAEQVRQLRLALVNHKGKA